jgi:hypothetical protein
MSTKSWAKSVARAMQDMVAREIKSPPPAYSHCLRMVTKYENDPGRPRTIEAFAAYIFDKEYP